LSERISDERIAQLLDGNVSAEERAELLSRLAANGNDFAVFAETGGVLRELEEAESGTEPPPLAETPPAAAAAPPADRQAPPSTRQRPRWGGRRARWLALVPVLALALLFPVLWSRGGAGGPGAPAAALQDSGLPRDWLERGHPWSNTRGSGDNLIERDAGAARVGALHADLALAIAAHDTLATEVLAKRIGYLLDEKMRLTWNAQAYRAIGARAAAPSAELQLLLEQAGKLVMEDLDANRVRLGSWAEAARIAAERHDGAFFIAPDARRAFARAANDGELPAAARAAASRLRDAKPGPWDALKNDADTVLRAIAG
jgi:hypothetical protein